MKKMKKTAVSLLAAISLCCSMLACSNWNRATPASMDGTTMEAEIRKNLAADHITGLTVNVNGGNVTLEGHLNQMDHDKAMADAQKVPGVTNVVDHINVM
jgi:osmotically-inducible protein OsmY